MQCGLTCAANLALYDAHDGLAPPLALRPRPIVLVLVLVLLLVVVVADVATVAGHATTKQK